MLYLALLQLLTALAPRNGRLDFHHVTVSRGHGARALECALLCVITRACGVPRTQDAYGLQRADIARVLSVAVSYVASSLVATPKNQRKPDSASLRSFTEQRYLARCVAPRDLAKSILNRVGTVS